jgi:hypothetical protein
MKDTHPAYKALASSPARRKGQVDRGQATTDEDIANLTKYLTSRMAS